LELQAQVASAKYTEAHPVLQDLRQQAAAVREVLEKEGAAAASVPPDPGQGREQLFLAAVAEEANLAALAAESQSLRTALAQARNQWKAIEARNVRLAELRREVDRRLAEERGIAASGALGPVAAARPDLPDLEVLQGEGGAVLVPRPWALHLLVGAGIGLLLACGLAWWAARRDHSLRSAAEAEQSMELPVLATIPRWTSRQMTRVQGD
jgi:hypothetical protein